MARIIYKRYALVNDQGVIWEGLTKPTRSAILRAYKKKEGEGLYGALAAGWTSKKITITFSL